MEPVERRNVIVGNATIIAASSSVYLSSYGTQVRDRSGRYLEEHRFEEAIESDGQQDNEERNDDDRPKNRIVIQRPTKPLNRSRKQQPNEEPDEFYSALSRNVKQQPYEEGFEFDHALIRTIDQQPYEERNDYDLALNRPVIQQSNEQQRPNEQRNEYDLELNRPVIQQSNEQQRPNEQRNEYDLALNRPMIQQSNEQQKPNEQRNEYGSLLNHMSAVSTFMDISLISSNAHQLRWVEEKKDTLPYYTAAICLLVISIVLQVLTFFLLLGLHLVIHFYPQHKRMFVILLYSFLGITGLITFVNIFLFKFVF